MKSIFAFTLICLIYSFSFSQTTYVPDLAFEAQIENGISGASNGIPNDHYVLTAPLQNLQGFSFQESSISDLTGLEDFSNITSLSFFGNFNNLDTIDLDVYNLPLKIINLSYLDALKYISFGPSVLEFVSINYCGSIEKIIFGSNQLTDNFIVHISHCDSLKKIDFSDLTFGLNSDVDIIGNGELEELTFGQISDTNINEFGFHLLPKVHCIQVSNPNYFFSKLSVGTDWWPEALHQSNLYWFSTDCVNPALGLNEVEINTKDKKEIGVFDLLGRTVQKDQSGIVLVYYSDGSFIRILNP